MKSYLVIGMGAFGQALATNLMEHDNEVMIVDKDTTLVSEISSKFTNAVSGDCTVESVVAALGVDNFDAVFVTIGEHFEPSLIATSLMKEHGAKKVITKSLTAMQDKFLLSNGADEVVNPEKLVAKKLALRFSGANNIQDFISISSNLNIYSINVCSDWIGKTIAGLDIRKKHNVNIIAIKDKSNNAILPSPEYVFNEGDEVIVMGNEADVMKLDNPKRKFWS